jgi:prolyl-tRNA editing enzyme YbaK/EbsC (Cys-tRNA(Pro) deacylase)
METTGMAIGGVTPFGLDTSELPVWIDERVVLPDWVILGGGSRSYKVKIDPAVFSVMDGAEVVTDLTLAPG